MKAIISDIHANLEALCAVIADIDRNNVDEIICLGDIVGYGADPEACVDLIMDKAAITLMGNHDLALLDGPIGFNPIAADLIRMTRERMDPQMHPEKKADLPDDVSYFPCADDACGPKCLICNHSEEVRWRFLGALPEKHLDDTALYVHASPLNPVHEYIFPDKFARMWNPERIRELCSAVPKVAFCGHTHRPCAITSTLLCYYPENVGYTLKLNADTKYIVNTGSVGQPRDGDARSSYVLFDEGAGTITWRRVAYNIDATVKKIDEMCGKNNFCGWRLRFGK
jgi:predicted phosphodiesterase